MKDSINTVQDIQNEIVKTLVSKLNDKLDQAFIVGLEKKGYYFDTKLQLEEFIKTKCRAEVCAHMKEKVFFVDDKPFMKWSYDIKLEMGYPTEYKATAEMGSYVYL